MTTITVVTMIITVTINIWPGLPLLYTILILKIASISIIFFRACDGVKAVITWPSSSPRSSRGSFITSIIRYLSASLQFKLAMVKKKLELGHDHHHGHHHDHHNYHENHHHLVASLQFELAMVKKKLKLGWLEGLAAFTGGKKILHCKQWRLFSEDGDITQNRQREKICWGICSLFNLREI